MTHYNVEKGYYIPASQNILFDPRIRARGKNNLWNIRQTRIRTIEEEERKRIAEVSKQMKEDREQERKRKLEEEKIRKIREKQNKKTNSRNNNRNNNRNNDRNRIINETDFGINNNFDIDEGSYSLLVGIKNVEKAVRDQIDTVKTICDENSGSGFLVNSEKESQLWDSVRDFPQESIKTTSIVCKSGVLVTQIPKLLDSIQRLSNEYSVKIYISTRAGNGISLISIEGSADSVKPAIENLRNFLSSIGGNLILQQASPEMKEGFDVWGDIGSGLGIMKRIKANYDPDNILNPGRFI